MRGPRLPVGGRAQLAARRGQWRGAGRRSGQERRRRPVGVASGLWGRARRGLGGGRGPGGRARGGVLAAGARPPVHPSRPAPAAAARALRARCWGAGRKRPGRGRALPPPARAPARTLPARLGAWPAPPRPAPSAPPPRDLRARAPGASPAILGRARAARCPRGLRAPGRPGDGVSAELPLETRGPVPAPAAPQPGRLGGGGTGWGAGGRGSRKSKVKT